MTESTITNPSDEITALKKTIKQHNIRLWVEQGQLKYSAPKDAMTAEIKRALVQHKPQLIQDLSFNFATTVTPELTPAPNKRYLPFPMTPIQQAYWVGEHGGYAQSCVPGFFHHVRFAEVEPEQLSRALYLLQHKHEVLRIRFFADGTQQIAIPGENLCQPAVTDLREQLLDTALDIVKSLAKQMSQELPALDQGPPLAAHLVRLSGEDHLLLSIRLNVIDGPSLKAIFRDLLDALFSPAMVSDDVDVNRKTGTALSFRDYALAIKNHQNDNSLAFWKTALATLPRAPDLPTTGQSPQVSSFSRLQGKLEQAQWQQLKDKANHFGVSINASLLSLFAATLRPWSQNKQFCLNMLLNYRPFYHPEMAMLTGNCTNNTLIDCRDEDSFLQQAKQLQEQMTQKIEHASVSGVSLLRQLQQKNEKPAVPFVFTSGVAATNQQSEFKHADKLEIISNHLQTPQVWLDHQVVESNGELLYFWDYVDDIFLPGIPQAIFQYYETCLHALLHTGAWEQLPAVSQHKQLPPVQDTVMRQAPNLARLLCERVQLTPDAVALITDEQQLTYRDLWTQAAKAASHIQTQGIKPQALVAIQIAKGSAQMIAILAIALCGATWLPLDIRSPHVRREHILKHSGCQILITDLAEQSNAKIINTASLLTSTEKYQEIDARPEDIAYVIYTSGSTGQPKGVVTTHAAVLNTIFAIGDLFEVSAEDRIIALSAASFDLSIYDLWGSIAVGAALVIPPDTEYPDPIALIQQCQRYKVTVWNSVPALLDMVLSVQAPELDTTSTALQTLRVIMLSGDWIPLKLAAKLRRDFPDARLYSLGGATEASIWSNYFPIKTLDPHWTSIPYGYPLSGQQLYVLDEDKNLCLTGVTGEIHLAGKGLANGYLNDKTKPDASFFIHSTGIRLYATGDLGRYRDNCGIEFLGRKDFQLKIRGYRIEAGEVEAQLEKIKGIKSSCVFSVMYNENPVLVACYTGSATTKTAIKETLSQQLPCYMLPDLLLHQTQLPLNANGKIDRGQLQTLTIAVLNEKSLASSAPEETDNEPLAAIWKETVGHFPTAEENFFQHGGSSLLAVHLLNAIKTEFAVEISLADIFNTPTFVDLLQLIQQRVAT